MKVYQVYYKVNPTFMEDKELTVARVVSRMGGHFKPVRILVAEDLEEVYYAMQGEVWSPNGEARPLIEGLGLRHTSMSVGDVIHEINTGKFYEVAMAGFREIPLVDPEAVKALEEI